MLRLDPRYGNSFLDCNALDRTDLIEDVAMDEILRLHDEPDTFTLLLPYSVKAEIEHPSTPPNKKRLAQNFVFLIEVQLTESELALHERVRAAIQGNAKPGRHHKTPSIWSKAPNTAGLRHQRRAALEKGLGDLAAVQLRVLRPSKFLAASYASVERDHSD